MAGTPSWSTAPAPRITDSNVDLVGLDGFVVTGAGSTLSGNGVQNARHGFIVTATALDTDLDTNETQDLDGDGFVVDGDTPVLTSNTAQALPRDRQAGRVGNRGFVIGGDSGLLDTNTAEDNGADGFVVTGNGNTLQEQRFGEQWPHGVHHLRDGQPSRQQCRRDNTASSG